MQAIIIIIVIITIISELTIIIIIFIINNNITMLIRIIFIIVDFAGFEMRCAQEAAGEGRGRRDLSPIPGDPQSGLHVSHSRHAVP